MEDLCLSTAGADLLTQK